MNSLALTLVFALGAEEMVLRAAVHIHTNFSDGRHSVDEIAQRAAGAGIDVVILNDHFMDEITYGVPLLREALAFKVAPPSLAPESMEAYLQAAHEAEQKTGVLILPGVKLTPFYYWEGSPFSGDLTLNSAHRHLMVIFPDKYAGDAGTAPYQEAIDAAASTSSLTFWAHPETSTRFRHARYPVDYRSEAYPEFLLRTEGADGFASLYEGRQAAAAGGFWDQALVAFVRGERTKPLWTVGALDLHAEGEAGGKFIGNVETVLRARERTKQAVVEALRTGAMYAVRQRNTNRLVLHHFDIVCGRQRARSGERVITDGPCRIEARLDQEGEPSGAVTLVLVRNGEVIDERKVEIDEEGVTLSWMEGDIPRDTSYYRLIGKRGNNPVLYTNPVFVFPKAAVP